MRITLTKLLQMARDRQRIAMISCYDAISARLVEMAGVDIILVGDSLGMLVQGHDSTLPVSMEEQLYHTRCVVRGCANPFILGDMPFGSYQASPQEAFANAALALRYEEDEAPIRAAQLLEPRRYADTATDWLRLTVDPRTPAVFSWEPQAVLAG